LQYIPHLEARAQIFNGKDHQPSITSYLIMNLSEDLLYELGHHISSTATLAVLCRVSKLCNHTFTPFLYKTINLQDGNWRLFQIVSRLPQEKLLHTRQLSIGPLVRIDTHDRRENEIQAFLDAFGKMKNLTSFS
jgi:hypothetical protein